MKTRTEQEVKDGTRRRPGQNKKSRTGQEEDQDRTRSQGRDKKNSDKVLVSGFSSNHEWLFPVLRDEA
jgi:hypothetical protein